MKKHTKVYFESRNKHPEDIILCEVCGAVACDLHHIECKGMGGSKLKDTLENIIAVCRKCHSEYGDKKQHKEFLFEIVRKILERNKR